MNAIKSRIKNLLSVSQQAVKNEKGLTLIEMLIAILIFILASVFIVSLVTSALDKPKEAGIKSAMNSYESAAQLILLETSGDIDGDDAKAMTEQLNQEVDPSAVFGAPVDGVISEVGPDTFTSELENAYGNPYTVTITEDVDTQEAVIKFSTIGAKTEDVFSTEVVYFGGEISVETKGFGRNDKDHSTNGAAAGILTP